MPPSGRRRRGCATGAGPSSRCSTAGWTRRALLEPIAGSDESYRYYGSAQARLMLADIQLRQGEPATAAATLRPWLEEAAQGGDIGGALFAGSAALQRLAGHDWGAQLTPAQRSLLQRVGALMHGGAPAGPAALAPAGRAAALPAALSEREREVLERIAAGDSNKLIARAFSLSPHTVKRHVANILDKLGVDTRGQAAARWREIG